MTLVSSETLVREAAESGRALAAFNVFCPEAIGAVVDAGRECGAPVIIAVNEADLAHLGSDEVVALASLKAARTSTPVVLHLDHGMSVGTIARCLRSGFTSVMFDPARLGSRERVPAVRSVVEFAHSSGVSVESMVGSLRLAVEGGEDEAAREVLTDPVEAAEFASRTGIDSLAVSVGTEHGAFLVGSRAEVNMDLLHSIARHVSIPLVIHGGSAIDDEQLREIRRYRVGKVNIGSAIRAAFRSRLRSELAEPAVDVREALGRARQAMYEVACRKITILFE